MTLVTASSVVSCRMYFQRGVGEPNQGRCVGLDYTYCQFFTFAGELPTLELGQKSCF